MPDVHSKSVSRWTGRVLYFKHYLDKYQLTKILNFKYQITIWIKIVIRLSL